MKKNDISDPQILFHKMISFSILSNCDNFQKNSVEQKKNYYE
jgi:hypothetical protein